MFSKPLLLLNIYFFKTFKTRKPTAIANLSHLGFAEFVVTGFKSNRINKTNNQNPFERILTTDKIRSNGI